MNMGHFQPQYLNYFDLAYAPNIEKEQINYKQAYLKLVAITTHTKALTIHLKQNTSLISGRTKIVDGLNYIYSQKLNKNLQNQIKKANNKMG